LTRETKRVKNGRSGSVVPGKTDPFREKTAFLAPNIDCDDGGRVKA